MAQISDLITGIVRRYVDYLQENGFPIRTAVLYGSYAKGTANEWSDIDVALVSDAFEGVRFSDKTRIGRLTLDIDDRLSPLPYRPEDFTPDNLFVREILQTGVRIV